MYQIKIIIILFLLTLLLSCGVKPLQSVQKDTSSTIELGSIGKLNSKLFEKQFQMEAILELQQKIRVAVQLKQFDKNTVKQFNKLQDKETNKITLNDTVKSRPEYLQFQLIDKVSLINEINAEQNKSIFDYLKKSDKSSLITSVSIRFPQQILKKIIASEEIYLSNGKNKNYALRLYKNDKKVETINFSQAFVFDYNTSGFCWAENEKHQIVITDISDNGCAKKSYKSYYKTIKKKKEFKY